MIVALLWWVVETNTQGRRTLSLTGRSGYGTLDLGSREVVTETVSMDEATQNM